MIGHYIGRYVAKIFLSRFFSTFFGLFGILLFIETLGSKKKFPTAGLQEQIEVALFKIPLLLHKTLPFLIFASSFLLFLRLIRYQELPAMHSGGASLWRILTMPLFITGLIGCSDLFILTPLSTAWLMKAQHIEKKEEEEEKWLFCQNKKGIVILHPIDWGAELFVFSPDFIFQKHYISEKMTFEGDLLLMEKVWILQPGLSPQFSEHVSLKNPKRTMQCRSSKAPHPSLMSFIQVHQTIFKTSGPQKISSIRWHYLLSNTFWMLSLTILAASLVIGKTTRMKRLGSVALGGFLCFFLYLSREWLYALGLSFSYLMSPLLLWVIPLLTVLIGLLILFEKNEL